MFLVHTKIIVMDVLKLCNFFLCCTDKRKGACWTVIRNGNCEAQISMTTLMEECCSTVGKAWGSPCQPCPTTGDSEFLIISVIVYKDFIQCEVKFGFLLLFLQLASVERAFTQKMASTAMVQKLSNSSDLLEVGFVRS